jgi:predicted component of type VI protein secretion system
MIKKPYSLFFQPAAIMRPGMHPRSELGDSIGDHIALIISSRLDSFRFDPDYGCSIWEQDFVTPGRITKLRDAIERSIEASIAQHEKRLIDIKPKVKIDDQHQRTEINQSEINRIKRRVNITISAKMRYTEEPFMYTENVYFSPMSWD